MLLHLLLLLLSIGSIAQSSRLMLMLKNLQREVGYVYIILFYRTVADNLWMVTR
jgi:hypothetical protein